jgi:transposase
MTNIPPKRNRKDPICFSPYLDRARNLIERFLNKIKQCGGPARSAMDCFRLRQGASADKSSLRSQ